MRGIVIAWMRIASMCVGLPYFNFRVANGLSLQIEHSPGNIEYEARRAPRPAGHLGQNADLTKVPGRPGRAAGLVLDVTGRVLNLKGEPVRNAKIEIWQANTHGRYTHPSDHNTAHLDPNFEGSALLTTDDDGRYRFKTIKPAAYPAGPNRMRPAHIHFQVSGRQDRLVTQMYL